MKFKKNDEMQKLENLQNGKKLPFINRVFAYFAVVFGGMYLLNFGCGVIEFLPDNFPIIGNIDEAFAIVLIAKSLKYLGYNIDIFESLFSKFKKKN